MPFFIPVDYYDTRLQFNEILTYITGNHTIKGGLEYNRTNATQTFRGFANGRYHLRLGLGLPELHEEPEVRRVLERHVEHRRATVRRAPRSSGPSCCTSSTCRVRACTVDQAGTQSIVQDGARGLHPGQVAAAPEPHDQLRPALGSADRARPDHAARVGLLRAVHREDVVWARSSRPTARSRPTTRCGSRASASPGTRRRTARRSSARTAASSRRASPA